MIVKTAYCNKCGKKLDVYDEQSDFCIHTSAGYGSEFDGKGIELDLCCDCMDELIKSCKISPIIERSDYYE